MLFRSRYQEMKDAGITHSFTGFPSADAMQKALDVAAKVGIKMVVSCPELKTDPEKIVKRFMNHPAVVGYHLQDEPSISQLKGLGEWGRRIQAIDKKNFCYVNLFPNFADSAQLGTKDYLEYVREYVKQIPLQFVSFDYYPVMKDRLSKPGIRILSKYPVRHKKRDFLSGPLHLRLTTMKIMLPLRHLRL